MGAEVHSVLLCFAIIALWKGRLTNLLFALLLLYVCLFVSALVFLRYCTIGLSELFDYGISSSFPLVVVGFALVVVFLGFIFILIKKNIS